LGPQSFGIQFTLSKNGHERLCYAQQLLGHQVPAGDLAAVFERALDALVHRLEKQKFAATSKPRPHVVRASANPRHIPAHVKRAVWQRDQGQCTFVSETGHRCLARGGLEFDHIQEVARGGQASISGIRLRCRAHNQYEAERTFGAEFMRHKRIAAAEAGRNERIQDAAACLRRLGFRAEEIRRAEELWGDPNTPLEEMIRSALKFLCPKARYGTSRAAAG